MASEQALRGFRVFADVLLDTTECPPDVDPKEWQLLPPQNRAAVYLMDLLAAHRIDLCGTFHVSALTRKVNPTTGEISWKI